MTDKGHCKSLLRNLSDYVDGELSPELCAELERHLEGCDNCQIVVNTLKKTIELYRLSTEEEHLPDDVRQRLFVSLELTDYILKQD
jgi:anti-sigma factor (TIGR02949 family)